MRARRALSVIAPVLLVSFPILLAEEERKQPAARPKFANELIRGKVVWMAEVLQRRFGVRSDPDAAKSLVALETAQGRLIPLIKDARGRGFMKDVRLRGREMELLVRRYEGCPLVEVITVYIIKKNGKKFELDYWCDICAIPMYELKDCECCQGPIRLRERPVADDGRNR